MKKLEFSLTSTLEMGMPVTGHFYTLRILPTDDSAQCVVLQTVQVQPCDESVLQHDGWGNVLFVGRALAAHEAFSYRIEGTASVDSARGRGHALNEAFRFASPLTQVGPAIAALHAEAGAFEGAAGSEAAFARAIALRTLVHERMDYVSGTTDVSTTAEQAAAQGTGVCQDYAHILAALLRADGIPARYVCGLMWGEGATHAWVEFYDGTTWWGEDPTNDCEAGDYYIALARGRDHHDCIMEQGVFRGGAMQRQLTHVSVQEREQ